MNGTSAETAVIGAGIVGIAVAYALCVTHGRRNVVLLEPGTPMGLTSAQSGDNYRNWWPHPVMRAFTDDSIGRMEAIAAVTGNRIAMTRRGYLLVTRRANPRDLIDELHAGYGGDADHRIRLHHTEAGYDPARSADWQTAPDGVDVLLNPALIRLNFPSLAPDVAAALHIRRGGDISGQQLGQFMLEAIRAAGGRLIRARVTHITHPAPFVLALETPVGHSTLRAEIIVNAAGPYIGEVAAMLGETLPIANIPQQKITFEDRAGAIPRTLPFTIDLDGQSLAWSDEDRALLAADPATEALAHPMPGGIHCRPDGGEGGKWIKLGWAYNQSPAPPTDTPTLDPHFPDVVLRAASRLHPSLAPYIGHLPRNAVHYGGAYTMTPENWPLIGPMRTPGAFLAGALSGFGTMSACAAGALCAAWITGAALPHYARSLSPARFGDAALMAELAGQRSKGVL